MISAYDKWLTTEPDNGFDHWTNEVWKLISEDEISSKDYEENEVFFDDGLLALSEIRTTSHRGNFVSPQFAALSIKLSFRILKRNPDCKTYKDVRMKMRSGNWN